MRSSSVLLLAGLASARGFVATFATFGNDQTKELIKAWAPKPLATGTVDGKVGDGLLPNSQENMKRFVRARILLEDPSTGCIACFGDSLSIHLTKFSKAEHQLLLPLWNGQTDARTTFQNMQTWHTERFGASDGLRARLSGAQLIRPDDRQAWEEGHDRSI